VVEWQDIDTAPKDGTEILLFGHRGDRMDIGSWCGCGSYRSKTKLRPAHFDYAWGSAGTKLYPTPTHWMPLPPPLAPR
jgi:hypothetical protein